MIPLVRKLLPVLTAGLLIAYAAGCSGLFSEEVEEGDYPEAPSFSIPALDVDSEERASQPTEFFSDFEEPVFAIFFTTTCPSCVQMVIDLHQQAREWEQRGLSVVIISGSGAEATADLLSKHQLQYEVYLDDERAAFGEADVRFVPTGMLVDSENRVILRATGWTDDVLQDIESAVQLLLD